MVRIRLYSTGAKKQISYRIVVTEARTPRDGRYIEKIGFYNPRTQPATVQFHEDRALYWLSQGAQPSDAVRRMMDHAGTLARFERLRQGEALEALVAEASATAIPAADPRTRRDDLPLPASKKKAKARAEAEAAEQVSEAPAGE